MNKKREIMKKLLSMAICLIILLIPSFSAFASQDIYLEEAEVTFSLPDDWIVLTRGMADDDPNVLRGGYNATELNKYFEENSIYLNAGPEGLPYELVITISDSEIQDFSLYSESELEDIGAAIDEDFASRGIQVNSYHLEDAGNESFIVLYHSQNHEDNPVYSKQYYTTNNYVAINFTLHSYTGTLESYMEQELDDIVNSVDFAITVDPEEDTDYAPTQAQEPFVPAADVPSDGVADSATAQASAESASGGSWIVIVLVAAAAVIAVVVIIAVVLSNKKKKQTPVPQGFTGAPPSGLYGRAAGAG